MHGTVAQNAQAVKNYRKKHPEKVREWMRKAMKKQYWKKKMWKEVSQEFFLILL